MTAMQNLPHILRSMKRIAPDRAYASWSRAEVLAAASQRQAPRITLATLFRGVGVAAMATLAFVGGLSLVRLTLSDRDTGGSVNQQALAAEAKAVDSQLALADVQNQIVAAVPQGDKQRISSAAANAAKSAAGTAADPAVDRALEALAE
ncbi:MAG: hypothetical protein IT514_15975 [Burkholderiales bacterium]|nr:hypothetical protein [Burkholderiales bacterium]